MSISFSNDILPALLTLICGIASYLYIASFVRSPQRRFIELIMALLSLFYAIVYFLLLSNVLQSSQVAEYLRPATLVLFAGIVADRIEHAPK